MTTRTTKNQMIEQIIECENSIKKTNCCAELSEDDKSIIRAQYSSKRFTLTDLRYIHKQRCTVLDEARAHKAATEYYNTEEGAAFKATMEDKLRLCHEQVDRLNEKVGCFYTNEIRNALGSNWDGCFSEGWLEIYMVDDKFKRIFGMEFTLRFREDAYYEGETLKRKSKIELNVNTMGSFELDSTRAEFYKDFARLMGKPVTLKLWQRVNHQYKIDMRTYKDKIHEIEAALKDPITYNSK